MAHFSRNSQISRRATGPRSGHAVGVFAQLYIEAPLADEDLADQVWELWGYYR